MIARLADARLAVLYRRRRAIAYAGHAVRAMPSPHWAAVLNADAVRRALACALAAADAAVLDIELAVFNKAFVKQRVHDIAVYTVDKLHGLRCKWLTVCNVLRRVRDLSCARGNDLYRFIPLRHGEHGHIVFQIGRAHV